MDNQSRMALLNEKRSQVNLGGEEKKKIKKQHEAGKKNCQGKDKCFIRRK